MFDKNVPLISFLNFTFMSSITISFTVATCIHSLKAHNIYKPSLAFLLEYKHPTFPSILQYPRILYRCYEINSILHIILIYFFKNFKMMAKFKSSSRSLGSRALAQLLSLQVWLWDPPKNWKWDFEYLLRV